MCVTSAPAFLFPFPLSLAVFMINLLQIEGGENTTLKIEDCEVNSRNELDPVFVGVKRTHFKDFDRI